MKRETEVIKDSVLSTNNGSAKYVQPTVVQESKPTIAPPKPSKFDPNLSRFTVKSLSSIRAELKTMSKKNDSPNLHVYQEQEPETITEVVETLSSQSTPLVPPPDSPRCSSKLDNHSDFYVYPIPIQIKERSGNPTPFIESIIPDSSHPSLTPVEGSDPVLEDVDISLNDYISTEIVVDKPSDPLDPELKESLLNFEKCVFDTAEECELPPIDDSIDRVEMFSDSDDDDSISCGDIEYVDEVPSELVSLEEENDEDIEMEIQDEALREKLFNINLLISKIEALNDPPISSSIPVMDSDFLLELEIFRFEETSSGSPTIHADISLPDYERFDFEIDSEFILSAISDNPTRGHLLENVDLFLAEDDSIPPGIENDENDIQRNILSDLPE
jgi:hypothetical protein